MNSFVITWFLSGCRNLWASFCSLFFPGACEICGDGLVKHERFVCSRCLADFPFVYHTNVAAANVILENFRTEFQIEHLYALFYYNKHSDYKKLIYNVKYHGRSGLAVWLGRMLGKQMIGSEAIEGIIPVPLHKKRKRKRGFNQAYEIAKGISEVTGIPVLNDVVVRVRNNASQTGKNAAERLGNVADVFELRHVDKIRGRHVLLLDDVITTGATIGACMRVLSEAGNVTFSLGCLALTD